MRSKGNFFLFKKEVIPGNSGEDKPTPIVSWVNVGGPYSDTLATRKEARKLAIEIPDIIGVPLSVMQIRDTFELETTETITVKALPKNKKEK